MAEKNTTVIDIVARLQDDASPQLKKLKQYIDRFECIVSKTRKQTVMLAGGCYTLKLEMEKKASRAICGFIKDLKNIGEKTFKLDIFTKDISAKILGAMLEGSKSFKKAIQETISVLVRKKEDTAFPMGKIPLYTGKSGLQPEYEGQTETGSTHIQPIKTLRKTDNLLPYSNQITANQDIAPPAKTNGSNIWMSSFAQAAYGILSGKALNKAYDKYQAKNMGVIGTTQNQTVKQGTTAGALEKGATGQTATDGKVKKGIHKTSSNRTIRDRKRAEARTFAHSQKRQGAATGEFNTGTKGQTTAIDTVEKGATGQTSKTSPSPKASPVPKTTTASTIEKGAAGQGLWSEIKTGLKPKPVNFLLDNALSFGFAGMAIKDADDKIGETVKQSAGIAGAHIVSTFVGVISGTLAGAAATAMGAAAVPAVGAVAGVAGSIVGAYAGFELFSRGAGWLYDNYSPTFQGDDSARPKNKKKIQEYTIALDEDAIELKNVQIKKETLEDLMKQLNDVDWEINNANLSPERMENAQNKKKEIVNKLAKDYPEYIDKTDLINPNLSTKLKGIDKLNESEAIRKREALVSQIEESEKSVDIAKKGFVETSEKIQELQEQKQNIGAHRDDMENKGLEIKTLTSKSTTAWDEGRYEDARILNEEIDNKVFQYNKDTKSYGVEGSVNRFAFNDESYLNPLEQTEAGIDNEIQKQKEIQNNNFGLIKQSYDARLTLIETDDAMPFAETAKIMKNLDIAQQTIFLNTIASIKGIKNEIASMPDKKFVEVALQVKPVSVVQSTLSKVPESTGITSGITSQTQSTSPKTTNTGNSGKQTTWDSKALVNETFENLKKNSILPSEIVQSKKSNTAVSNSDNATKSAKLKGTLGTGGLAFYENGGIVNKAHVGVVGEAGAEAIIPLTGTNQHRGIRLWEQAGQMLGILPKHSQGGIYEAIGQARQTGSSMQAAYASNTPVSVQMGGMNFVFNGVDTSSKEGILQSIRQEMPEIANEMAEALAKMLQQVFPNMKMEVESI